MGNQIRIMKYITLAFCFLIIFSTSAYSQQVPASPSTREANNALLKYLPFNDKSDIERTRRGFIATLDEPVIKEKDGTLVYDTSLYNFMEGDAPDTVNPILWRQAG